MCIAWTVTITKPELAWVIGLCGLAIWLAYCNVMVWVVTASELLRVAVAAWCPAIIGPEHAGTVKSSRWVIVLAYALDVLVWHAADHRDVIMMCIMAGCICGWIMLELRKRPTLRAPQFNTSPRRTLQTAGCRVANALGPDGVSRVVVQNVDPGSPAAVAGLRQMDEVHGVLAQAFMRTTIPPGGVPMQVVRSGQRVSVTVT